MSSVGSGSFRVVVAVVGVSVAVAAMMLAVSIPVAAAVSDVVGEARSGSGVVGAWTSRTVSAPAGKSNRLLLLVRCPLIQNGSGLVPLLLRPSNRDDTAPKGGAG